MTRTLAALGAGCALFLFASPAQGAISSWGPAGSGDGQFSQPPQALANDADGNVYALDPAGRVEKFSPAGAFLTKWSAAGSGFAFSYNGGLAIDRALGEVLLSARRESPWAVEVQTFSTGGSFMRSIGTYGSGEGELSGTGAVAVGADALYVADGMGSSARIQKFTSAGAFVKKIGTGGSGEGQYQQVRDMEADAAGSLYVLDAPPNQAFVSKFDSTGAFVKRWGGLGAGPGQFNMPGGLGIDALGYVYVADQGRIQKFDGDGNPVATWKPRVPEIQYLSGLTGMRDLWPQDVSMSHDGTVYFSSMPLEQYGNQLFRADRAPIAVLVANRDFSLFGGEIKTSQLVDFDASWSEVPFGTVTKYEWDLDNDGVFETDTGALPTASGRFITAGTHEVKVRVTGSRGGSTIASTSVQVVDSQIMIWAGKAAASTGEQFTLDAAYAAIPRSTVLRHQWDFEGDGTFELDTGASPKGTHVYETVGERTIVLRITRSGGRVDTASLPIEVRLAPPDGEVGVSVNNGAIATNDPNVQLNLVWPGFSKRVLISNDGSFTPRKTLDVAPVVPWRLQESGSERLPKTVYVRYRGAPGPTQSYTDDIILDQTQPLITSALLPAAPASVAGKAKLRVAARDNSSGVAAFQLARSKGGKKITVKVKRRRRVERTVRVSGTRWFVRAKDAAGNKSKWVKARARR